MIHPVRGRAAFAAFRRASTGRCGAIRARFVGPPSGTDRTTVAYALTRRSGNAVTRNRIRRRLRPIVGEIDRRGGLVPGGSYLLSAGAEAADCAHPDLVRWLETALRRAHHETRGSG